MIFYLAVRIKMKHLLMSKKLKYEQTANYRDFIGMFTIEVKFYN